MIRSLLLLFTIWSLSFHDNGTLPGSAVYNGNGCHGANQSPDLQWKDAPRGTKSFALIIDDKDAPGSHFYHWVLLDIPARIHHLQPGTRLWTPGTSSWGERAYGGPCPPPGKPHHYVFHLYALKVRGLDARALLQGKFVIGEAKLTGIYEL